MNEPLLTLKNVTAGYGNTDTINDISFSVGRGEIFAIVGESGCGKSTTLKAIMGLPSTQVRQSGGEIIFDGRDMSKLSREERRRLLGEEICTVFQNPTTTMNPKRKIKKQFLEAIRSHRRVDKKAALASIYAAFETLGLTDCERILESCPFELSVGMCQRVCLALAMVMEPKLILADEVTSALDVMSQQQVVAELKHLRDDCGISIVLVTHNMAVAAQLADNMAIMLDGRIVECGATKNIIAEPQYEYTKKLIADIPRLTNSGGASDFAEILLEVKSVSRAYKGKGGKVQAVDDVSFPLCSGEVLGIVGESGNGKSTLARQLLRIEKPDSGEIYLDGIALSSLRGKELRNIYTRAQMVFQTPVSSFDPRKRIRASIKDALKNLTELPKDEMDARIDELMRQVGLDPSMADRYPHQLSGGECQRAAIARALAAKPKLLVCDEATSALDVTVQARIVELLRELVSSRNMSMVFISHDIALVSQLCHRILVLKDGKCVEYGNTAELISSPKSEYTKRLLDAASSL